MVPSALALAVLAGAVTAQAPADDDARAVLQEAAAALRAMKTVSYDSRLEIRAAGGERVATGHVIMSSFDGSSGHGLPGLVAVSGSIFRGDSSQIKRFRIAFDGTTVRRYLTGSGKVLQADLGYGGKALIQGGFGALILWHFLDAEPFRGDLAASEVSLLGTEDVDGRPADVVKVVLHDGANELTWLFDRESHQPVMRRRRFRSASGNLVESVLIISNVQVGGDVSPGTFTLPTPDGATVEQMGRRPPDPFEVGDMAPPWTLKDSEGVDHSMQEYRGKLVIMDFWATWCPHCRNAMPFMQRLHDTYSSRGVAILGINCRERSQADPVKFVRDRGFDYPILLDGNAVAPRYRVGGIPAFFVIGPDGRLLYRGSGFGPSSEQNLLALIEQFVADDGR